MNIFKSIKEIFQYTRTTAKEYHFGLDTLIAAAAAGFFVAWGLTAGYITFGENSAFSDMNLSTFLLYCVLTWAFLVFAVLALRDLQVIYVCLGFAVVYMGMVYGLYIGNNLWPLLGVDFVIFLVFRYIWTKQKNGGRARTAVNQEAAAAGTEKTAGKETPAEITEKAVGEDTPAEMTGEAAGEDTPAEMTGKAAGKDIPTKMTGKTDRKMSKAWLISFAGVSIAFLAFFLAIGWYASLRYKMYISPTFDFGIFAQMFEQMAKTGLPYTTLERSTYFSHYGVHFSPALYLLLPGYMLFRSPEYLIYAQAFCVGLGVFPVWLICREFHFSPKTCFLGAMLYLLFPTVGLGCFKDFHENKMLAVLLLWLIYFYIKKKYAGMAVFALLTMMVKEDAAIYTASVGLWMFFYAAKDSGLATAKTSEDRMPMETVPMEISDSVRTKDMTEEKARGKVRLKKVGNWFTESRIGMILFLFSLIYFLGACAYVNSYGEGIMLNRFNDYILTEDGGLTDVIKNCVLYFGYMIQNVFQEEKMEFVFWMLTPVAFLPLRNRKISIWLLFVPMFLVNILPDWLYQYDIEYQYTYGTAALVLVAAFFTVRNWSRAHAEFAILVCVALCVPMFMGTTVSKAVYYNGYWDEEHQEQSALTTEALSVIPEGASVTATSNITAHLYWVDELYSIPDYYGPLQRTDYYVINYATDYSGYDESPWDIVAEGYELVLKQGKVAIYQRVD